MRSKTFQKHFGISGGIDVHRGRRGRGGRGGRGGGVAVQIPENIPDDIVTRIISWLPARVIMSVCRGWSRRYENPLLIRLQRESALHPTRTASLLLMDEDMEFRSIEYNPRTTGLVSNLSLGPSSVTLNDFHRMVASLHGLVLFKWLDGRCVIWNPIIGLFWSIPSPPTPPVLQNQNINFSFGFAYYSDSRREEYQLVRIVHAHGQDSSLVTVYRPITEEVSEWNSIPYAFPDPYPGYVPDGVFFDRYLFWIAVPTIVNNPQTVILRYDPVSSVFSRITAPLSLSNPNPQRVRHLLGVYDGLLCLYRSRYGEAIDIIVIDYGGGGWDTYRTIPTQSTDLRRFLPIRGHSHDLLRLSDLVVENLALIVANPEQVEEVFQITTSTLFRDPRLQNQDRVTVIPDVAITEMQPWTPTLLRFPHPDPQQENLNQDD